jgi:hypothetical protein
MLIIMAPVARSIPAVIETAKSASFSCQLFMLVKTFFRSF